MKHKQYGRQRQQNGGSAEAQPNSMGVVLVIALRALSHVSAFTRSSPSHDISQKAATAPFDARRDIPPDTPQKTEATEEATGPNRFNVVFCSVLLIFILLFSLACYTQRQLLCGICHADVHNYMYGIILSPYIRVYADIYVCICDTQRYYDMIRFDCERFSMRSAI